MRESPTMQPNELKKTKEHKETGRRVKEPLLSISLCCWARRVVDAAGHSLGLSARLQLPPVRSRRSVSELIWGEKNELKAAAPASFEQRQPGSCACAPMRNHGHSAWQNHYCCSIAI